MTIYYAGRCDYRCLLLIFITAYIAVD